MLNYWVILDPDGTVYVSLKGQAEGRVTAYNPDGTQKWAVYTATDILLPPVLTQQGGIYVIEQEYSVPWEILISQA